MAESRAPDAVPTVRLREVAAADLPAFFEHQLDPEANHMAAFAADDPSDRPGFIALWTGILGNDRVVKRTILADGLVAGNIVHFEQHGLPAVGYWLGRAFWGRGVATAALREFLATIPTRPLYARAAKDHVASLRVLEKCGFVPFGNERSYASARRREIDEVVLILR